MPESREFLKHGVNKSLIFMIILIDDFSFLSEEEIKNRNFGVQIEKTRTKDCNSQAL